MTNSRLLFILLFIFSTLHLAWAQNEETENNTVIDTVIIKKDPVIIVKKVYVTKEKVKKENHWIDFYFSPVFHDNIYYQSSIPLSYNYMLKLQAHTDPMTGYNAGLRYTYFLKNISLNTGLSFISYRDYFFSYNSSFPISPLIEEEVNTYTYLEGSLNLGYKFSLKRLHVTPYAGIIAGRLIAMRGTTFSPEDEETLVDLKDADLHTPYAYSATLGLNIAYNLSKKTRLYLEPFYREDLQSVMKSSLSFSLRRTVFGIRLGMAFAF